MKRIIIVSVGDVYKVPPIQSLLIGLSSQNVEIHMIVTKGGIDVADPICKGINVIELSQKYESYIPLYKKGIRMLKLRRELWTAIDKIYDPDSLLWVISDVTVKNLGKELLNRNYVLQLYELLEIAYMVPRLKCMNLHIGKVLKYEYYG